MIYQLKDINPYLISALAVVVPALLLLAFNFVLKRNVKDWNSEERGFEGVKTHWNKVFYSAWLGGWIVGILALVISKGNLYATLLFAILGYVLIFSSITDTLVHKAPKEVAHVGILSSLPVAIFAIINHGLSSETRNNATFVFLAEAWQRQLLTAGVWFFLLLIILFISRGGLGMADFRLFLLFGVALSWWTGIMGMFIMFFIANVMQIVVFFPAKKFKWGHMIKTSSGKEKWAVPFIPVIATVFLSGSLFILSAIPVVTTI